MFSQLIRKVKNVLPKNTFSQNVIKIIGGTGLGHLFSLIMYPVLTRLYQPADFGILAVFVSSLSIISVLGSLRYEYAIPLPDDNEKAINVLFLSLSVLFVITSIVGFIAYFTSESLATLAEVEKLSSYWWGIPLGLIFFGVFQNFNFWAIRIQNFKSLAISKFFQAFGVVLTQIVLFGVGAGGLIIGHVTGYLIASLVLLLFLKDSLSHFQRYLRACEMKSLAKRYRKFPLISSFSGLVNSLGLYIPSILLTIFYDVEVAGFFALTQRVISAPLTLVGKSIAQVYYSEVTKGLNNNPKGIRRLFTATVKKLFFFSILPIIILFAFAPFAFAAIFGKEWTEAGYYLRYLSPLILAQIVVNPISQTLLILERQFLQLVWDVLRLLLVVSVFFLFKNEDARLAMIFYSLVMTVAYLAMLAISRYQLFEATLKKSEGGG